MPRLIDAEKLPKYTGYALSADEIAMAVENAPTVDAVEVVRCKDCKYYWRNNRQSDGVVCLATPKDDAYCSEGERREDGKEE